MICKEAVNEQRTRTHRLGIAAHLKTRASLTSITLFTHDRIEIQARSIIFCTGYELPKIVASANTQVMAPWAIATRPQPMLLWPQKALIWEASDPHLYIRSSVDGRVICGGEDQKVATTDQRNALTERKARRIQHKLSQMFPRLDSSAEFSWTGSFGISPDGMPTIGEIPGFPKSFSVIGFGGNGFTLSMLASKLIVAAIQKKSAQKPNYLPLLRDKR